jgi:hypothetical protein
MEVSLAQIQKQTKKLGLHNRIRAGQKSWQVATMLVSMTFFIRKRMRTLSSDFLKCRLCYQAFSASPLSFQ